MCVQKLFDPSLPLIMANKDQLHEAFVAFILNSLDAIIKEGCLSIKTVFDKRNNAIEIAFSDNGKGIKREDLNRLGEPFFTTKNAEKGLGLGLAMAYEIIAYHKGSIEVHSLLGKGTRVMIKLPLDKSMPS